MYGDTIVEFEVEEDDVGDALLQVAESPRVHRNPQLLEPAERDRCVVRRQIPHGVHILTHDSQVKALG